jgi:hypothetical protein
VVSRADKAVKVANTKVDRAVSKAADNRSPASRSPASSSRNLDAKVASKVAVKADSRVSARPSPFL